MTHSVPPCFCSTHWQGHWQMPVRPPPPLSCCARLVPPALLSRRSRASPSACSCQAAACCATCSWCLMTPSRSLAAAQKRAALAAARGSDGESSSAAAAAAALSPVVRGSSCCSHTPNQSRRCPRALLSSPSSPHNSRSCMHRLSLQAARAAAALPQGLPGPRARHQPAAEQPGQAAGRWRWFGRGQQGRSCAGGKGVGHGSVPPVLAHALSWQPCRVICREPPPAAAVHPSSRSPLPSAPWRRLCEQLLQHTWHQLPTPPSLRSTPSICM